MTQFKPPKNSQILETRCAESALELSSVWFMLLSVWFMGLRIDHTLEILPVELMPGGLNRQSS